MSLRHYLKMGVRWLAPITVIIGLANLIVVSPAWAEGGLALSGNFYRQNFEIPQGASASGPDIYVVVFNQSDKEFNVRMTAKTPLGVNITLSHQDFTLPAKSQQQIFIGVEVSQDAAPAEYEIVVTAESYIKGATGIQIAGAASQTASLTVLGESASVEVRLLTPDGQPLISVVRLYRVIDGKNFEIAYSETGTLKQEVAPGNFVAVAYVGGEKKAEEVFSVAAGEYKDITLSAATVYFESFTIVPNYYQDTGSLGFTHIVYTVRNLFEPVAEATVTLEVSRDGVKQDEISLADLKPLDMGRVGLNYNYIPSAGWIDGTYGFRLSLMLNGKPYATTLEEFLDVSGSPIPRKGTSPLVIGSTIAGALLILGVGALVWRRRRA